MVPISPRSRGLDRLSIRSTNSVAVRPPPDGARVLRRASIWASCTARGAKVPVARQATLATRGQRGFSTRAPTVEVDVSEWPPKRQPSRSRNHCALSQRARHERMRQAQPRVLDLVWSNCGRDARPSFIERPLQHLYGFRAVRRRLRASIRSLLGSQFDAPAPDRTRKFVSWTHGFGETRTHGFGQTRPDVWKLTVRIGPMAQAPAGDSKNAPVGNRGAALTFPRTLRAPARRVPFPMNPLPIAPLPIATLNGASPRSALCAPVQPRAGPRSPLDDRQVTDKTGD